MALSMLPPTVQDAVYNSNNLADETLAAWRMVKRTSTGVAYCDAGDTAYGVNTTACASGAYAEVAVEGTILTCECSGAVTVGAQLKAANDGKLQAASTGDTACGIAESAGTDTKILFRPSNFKAV